MSRLFFASTSPLSVTVGSATLPFLGLAETKNFSAHQCVYSFDQYEYVHLTIPDTIKTTG